MNKIKISCNKRQYSILIDALAHTPPRGGRCFLGKDHLTCPVVNGDNIISCQDCLKTHIKREQEENS